MNRENLRYIFSPRSVAVIGASARPGSVGQALFSNVLLNDYTGVVYPVHSTAKSILAVKAYQSILHIPDEVDLAVVVVPAVVVPEVIAECGEKGVKGAIVISAGFKEMGPKGAQLEDNIREKAQKYGIALVGPNCFGMINTDPNVRLNVTFGQIMPRHGNIAFISQSGAVGVAALEYAQAENVGMSRFISIGNKADVNENDVLAYLEDDDETDVILLYLEDLADPREFMRIARGITAHPTRPKPILAIKSGRTSEGAKAASSHTGALAGSDDAYNAFFTQSRIIRVESLSELFMNAEALASQPRPDGPNVAILTNAGGLGIMATDACIRNGLKMAQLSAKTIESLKSELPENAATGNPVDIIGDADEKRYGAALRLLTADSNVDGIMAIWTPTLMARARDVADTIAGIGQQTDKPILACIQTMSSGKEIRAALQAASIPYYRFPEDAARAMAAMSQFSQWSRRSMGTVVHFADTDPSRVRAVLEAARSRRPVFLSEPEGHEILKAYGLPVPDHQMVSDVEKAAIAAREIGYPVVLKIVSPQILHKTEVGGVRVNIQDEGSLRLEFAALLASVASKMPDAEIWGVMVQGMARQGLETILGMERDPQFGPLLMFGLGGIMVEALRDVSFRVAPIDDIAASEMITSVRAYKLLQGFRGQPPRDIVKAEECLQRLSQLVTEFDDFAEIDLNPLLVYEENEGALVLDARFVIKQE